MSPPEFNHIKTALQKHKNNQEKLAEAAKNQAVAETVPAPVYSPPPPLTPPEALKPLHLDRARLTAEDIFQRPAAAKEFNRLSDWLLKTVEVTRQSSLTLTGIGLNAGCSTMAWSLAQAWARARPTRRVVLLETNWQSPGLEKIAGLPQGPGLSDYLTGRIDLADFLGETGLEQLILGGAGEQRHLSPMMLEAPRVRNLMYSLKRLYPDQLTIIDAPALADPESLLLSQPGDNLLVIANQSTVLKNELRFAASLLKQRRLSVLALVMNRSRGFH